MNDQVLIPEDRTLKTPSRGFCRNPECQEPGTSRFEFTVEHAEIECPKCKANRSPMIGLLSLTHLLVLDPQGMVEGELGKRYKIACDTTRAYLATLTNAEAATDNIDVYNCPGCAQYIQNNLNQKTLAQNLQVEKIIKENQK